MHDAKTSAFSLIEVCVAMAFATLLGVVLFESLLQSEQLAASARMMNNARAVVQRNLNACNGVLFSSTTSTPAVLATTSANGEICTDDGTGGKGVPYENIQIVDGASQTAVTGTLRRFVSNEPLNGLGVSGSVPILRITFKVDYDFRSRHYTYSQTTLRSIDSQ